MAAPRFTRFVASLGVQLTPGQRALTRVAFDGAQPAELKGEERELARQLFGPVDEIPASARRVFVAVCGRGSGKTFVIGALYSLWRALTAEVSGLAPGEQATALVVAPDLRLARQCLRFAHGQVKEHPELAELVETENTDTLAFRRPDGALVAIEVLPATRGGSAVRGRSLVSAVLDESAFFRDESAVVNDAAILAAVAPRVMPGGMVVLCSTPWVEAGLLHREFVANWGAPARALAAKAPLLLMRDTEETRELVARERERDPDNTGLELDAEFMTGGAGLLFNATLLKLAVDRELPPRLSAPGTLAAVGGDIGLVHDSSAFVAVHVVGDDLVIADVLELRPKKGEPLKLSEVVLAGAQFAERHGVRSLWVDHHVLEPAREHLPEGFFLAPVPGGQAPKAERFIAFRDELRERQVRIPGAFARLVAQLVDVVARPVPGGGTSIVMPRRGGAHGDIAAAAINAAWAARRFARPLDLSPPRVRPRAARATGGY